MREIPYEEYVRLLPNVFDNEPDTYLLGVDESALLIPDGREKFMEIAETFAYAEKFIREADQFRNELNVKNHVQEYTDYLEERRKQ